MNKKSRILLDAAVDFMQTLHFKAENIMVTGSIALDLQGLLPKEHDVHDVDLLIKTDEQSWRSLKLLEAIHLSDESNPCKNTYPGSNEVIFKFKDLTLNIWKNDWKEESSIKDASTGVYVATANRIIAAKKGYNREKDVRDICAIVKEILR